MVVAGFKKTRAAEAGLLSADRSRTAQGTGPARQAAQPGASPPRSCPLVLGRSCRARACEARPRPILASVAPPATSPRRHPHHRPSLPLHVKRGDTAVFSAVVSARPVSRFSRLPHAGSARIH